MFTQPLSSPPSVGPGTTSVTNTPSPSSTRSRLRGLSYLRNYTQNHLLSRDSGPSTNQTTPTSSTHAASASQSQTQQHQNSLTRSVSYPHSPTPASLTDGEPSSHRMSLVVSHQEPLSSDSAGVSAAAPPSTATATGTTSGESNPTTNRPPSDAGTRLGEMETATRTRSATNGETTSGTLSGSLPADAQPSIRLSAYLDPRATRPSLTFAPVARTLPTGSETIRVGRYSERDNQPNVPHNMPSAAPVGFKSKVVSRRHCEFWCQEGKWFIRDVKSSSGTFLNHIRLSPPGTESKPFPINDGDIVQLGIDFKGGEEMIFRCVKMRLELNRGWQSKPNAFNVQTHKRLRNMASSGASTNSTSQDCSICLNSIAPCQSLFVAPCSHTWHYKCIRSLLNTPSYPIFVCPNCRMAADLEADIEDLGEDDWEQVEAEGADPSRTKGPGAGPQQQQQQQRNSNGTTSAHNSDGEPMDMTTSQDTSLHQATEGTGQVPPSSNAVSRPVNILPPVSTQMASAAQQRDRDRTPSPPGGQSNPNEGPITPRNDAGPWVFDGSAAGSRAGSVSGPSGTGGAGGAGADTGGEDEAGAMRSLDAAAEMDIDGEGHR